MEVAHRSGAIQMGIVVDAVSEVQAIRPEDVEPTPSFGTALDTQYIKGMAKIQGRVTILLDIDKVLTNQEVTSLTGEA
jgi:purine-binding chemotaxis protein CheW